MEEIIPTVHTWSRFSEEKGFDFNGYAIQTEQGTVVIDPPDPGQDGWGALDALAPYEGVFVTNRNHSRAAAEFRDRYSVPLRVGEADSERTEAEADEAVRGGETVAGEVTLVAVPGKSPGEIAFHLPSRSALVVGDLVIGVPPGELSTYPDEKIDDKEELLRSAAKLLELDFDALLVCDGEPLVRGGKEKLRRFLQQ